MKKKIVIIHPVMCMGGEERILNNMLNILDYSKVDVTLWLSELGGFLEKDVNSNVHIKHLDYKKFFPENSTFKLFRFYLKSGCVKSALYSLFFNLKVEITKDDWLKKFYKNKAYGLIDKTEYDLMIIYHSYTEDLLYWGLTRFTAKKRALWMHGPDYYQLENDLREPVYKLYDRIFCICNDVKEDFCRRFPKIKDKTSIFYNIQDIEGILRKSCEPCDYNIFSPSIISVARVAEVKGFDCAPVVIRKFLDNGYNVHWYIVGDGPDRGRLEKLCNDYDVKDNIHFLGNKDNPYPYVKQSDIYVLPTKREGYCTSTIEAKVLKKPVIVTDVCGMREQFIDGVTGIIVKDNNPDVLYEKIKELIDNPDYKQMFIDNLNDEKFRVTNDLSQLYDLLDIK